jgi:hypothetical protein
MTDQNKPASVAQRRTMYFILGLPVAAVVVILGIGTYAQWDEITPRWKQKETAEPATPTPEGATTNAEPAAPVSE